MPPPLFPARWYTLPLRVVFLPLAQTLSRSPLHQPTPPTIRPSPRPYRSLSHSPPQSSPGPPRQRSPTEPRSPARNLTRPHRFRVHWFTRQPPVLFRPPAPSHSPLPSLRLTQPTTRLSRRQCS